ncbi:putative transcription factor SSXT family [Helianthus annuus]|uniref:Putative SS18 family n=1 Tax=Helianthus annuus TaxID=4232 RepID=A0A251UNI8_HELAN|nr:GRF1-interacting factor 2 [Helianthus annuus]KAF5810137.1 putative transcription factor SSXT family [Helianthus annuus]KAJ0588800.1 putative transcription factor SSXT family [Helianthus annuus]KAJ0926804.1 putative transcription factor SSXT family [Helianthus annuus]KAJ0931258.1 putative transcription factor SSXT family [Helianthus annuus]
MQPQQPPASKPPLSAITTEQIQKCLEDNKNLIMAILECQKLGRFQECAQYQAVLQKNLMYLAAIADAQPPTPQTPNPSQVTQTPPNPTMQQPGGGQKLPFQVNSIYTQDQQQQQQQLLLQQQQQFQAQAGIRAGVQHGLFGMQSPEVAYGGGDGRGFFFDNGSFRDS